MEERPAGQGEALFVLPPRRINRLSETMAQRGSAAALDWTVALALEQKMMAKRMKEGDNLASKELVMSVGSRRCVESHHKKEKEKEKQNIENQTNKLQILNLIDSHPRNFATY